MNKPLCGFAPYTFQQQTDWSPRRPEVSDLENMQQELTRLQSEFRDCRKLLNALGNETRQYLLYVLLDGPCGGRRVIELARRTHLSRPSISHHI